MAGKRLAVAFIAIQAIIFLGLLACYYDDASPGLLWGSFGWALISVLLAALLAAQGKFAVRTAKDRDEQENAAPEEPNLLGLPGKELDIAGLCAITREGIALIKDSRIIYINPALSYILAAHEEEVMGTRITAYIHPEDISLISLEDSGGGPSRATLRLNTRLGDVRWVICSVHHVEWHGGNAQLLLFENIGALRQTQQALDEHEHRARILLERTPLGIAMFDGMGQLKLSNTAWNALWSSIVGNNGRRFNILQDPFLPNTAVEKAVRQAFNKKDSGISSFEHAAPWGETRWLNLNFHPMTDPMGKLIGVTMIQQDITDHVRSVRRENELNDQLTSIRHELAYCEGFIAQVQDKARHIIISFEQNGVITGWNQQAEKRFSLPKSKAIGLNYKRLAEELQPYLPALQEAMIHGRPCTLPRLERFDANGAHYEKIRAYTVQLGFKNIVLLEIKDITAQVSGKNMQEILEHFAAASSISRAISAAIDIASAPPAAGAGEERRQERGNIIEGIGFFSSQQPPLPRRQLLAMGDVIDNSLEKITREHPSRPHISKSYAAADTEISADLSLLLAGLNALYNILLGMDFGGKEPSLSIRQGNDGVYTLVNISVPARDNLGLTKLETLLPRTKDDAAAFALDDRLKALYPPLQLIASCGGILTGYSTELESGFTCRFILPDHETTQISQV